MFDEAKVKEQPMQTAGAILSIADVYSPEVFEKACDKALGQYHMPYYKTIYSHARSLNSAKELTEFKENNWKLLRDRLVRERLTLHAPLVWKHAGRLTEF